MNLDSIFLVVVLYKSRLENSETIKSLNHYFKEFLEVYVYDNSPLKQYQQNQFSYGLLNVNYVHNGSNPGLSYAYNSALKEAKDNGKKWMLLLDQDTTLTSNYFDELLTVTRKDLAIDTVAIIPRVISNKDGRKISPSIMTIGGLSRPKEINPGIIRKKISGINSGTVLYVPFLNTINGFSSDYTLDMLDHWYFREIFIRQKSLYLLNSHIIQDLSVYGNFEDNMSISRYKQLLSAESNFIKNEGFLNILIFKLRLIFRLIKQLRFSNSDYFKTTLASLCNYN